jgi:hypothetical protein
MPFSTLSSKTIARVFGYLLEVPSITPNMDISKGISLHRLSSIHHLICSSTLDVRYQADSIPCEGSMLNTVPSLFQSILFYLERMSIAVSIALEVTASGLQKCGS